MVKTQKLVDWQHDRVEKVKKVRENAVNIAMEKSAKHILHEKKLARNEKRYKD